MADLEEEEEEEEWQKKLRKTIMEVAGLTPEQAKICMQHIKKTFKEKVGDEAKKVAKNVVKDEQELGKCRRSILMHNSVKWVAGDRNTQGYTLAKRVIVSPGIGPGLNVVFPRHKIIGSPV
jgi:ABC-type Zn2+ transport system substrate-binding protein/surface adhesin